ncbi:MAG: hypothetical protein PF440_05765 [Thiomicrorhabdus sp.]|jgi:DNA-binding transcriptional regulator LsrR (DeoR family)|nr:hypothetical protein [Thiomicrorhabdus sp.]
MKLCEWKAREKLTNSSIAEKSGIHESKVDRILREGGCVKIIDAYKIIKLTHGEVSFEDLHLDCD